VQDIFQTPIEFLKGVGPQRAKALQDELGIYTFVDLLHHFPFRYVDRSLYHTIRDLPDLNSYVQLKGRITHIQEHTFGRQKRLAVKFQDETGLIELVWFQGIKWVKPLLRIGEEYQVYGKAKIYQNSWNIPHPEVTLWSQVQQQQGLQPIYPTTEKLSGMGLHARGIGKLTAVLLPQLKGKISEILPSELLAEQKLLRLEDAYFLAHHPTTAEESNKARFRLKFNELLALQMEMLLRKQISIDRIQGAVFSEVGEIFNDFYHKHLPFELTQAQKRVIREIRKDLLSGKHMNRLLQGDVGSGKTLVALMAMLLAVGNDFQAVIMAPTEILANQHYETIREMLSDLPVNIGILTGSTRKAARTKLHEELRSGSMQMLVGTHALLEDEVQFKNLGMVVIDEQHRFGVAQRAKMRAKNTTPPHILIMTATPIPRTLAMTFYGDLEVSVIDELPPGRKPIQTTHRYESSRLRVFGFIQEEIKKGRQVYIVYPLISESEKLDFNNLISGYEAISRAFPLPDYRVSIVHGKMKAEEKDFEMQRFIKGETQIMVATTVIEVGVNVPNASVMVIESAERFGLSQLHQLRGRVGRGAEKSYCILMTGYELSKDTLKRMETMVRTNDGFEIAEVDLQLRGPGDLMGTQQSGMLDLQIADLAKDGPIVGLTRDVARNILKSDPKLTLPKHAGLRQKMLQVLQSKPDWGKIA
jgi:ATP-dependent DNA helicase RecG